MATVRYIHTATLLNDGTVLVAGGESDINVALASAERFDPRAGVFSPTASMRTARIGPTATLLNDGTVLVAGGGRFDAISNSTVPFASAELFDPANNTFTPTGSMTTGRFFHTATLLSDGTVLIAGGSDSGGNAASTAELFDPASKTFAPTGGMTMARFAHSATRLPDGTVLVTGGTNFATAELFEPTMTTFTLTGSMGTARWGPTATLLDDGSVLVISGMDAHNDGLRSAELFRLRQWDVCADGQHRKNRRGRTYRDAVEGRYRPRNGRRTRWYRRRALSLVTSVSKDQVCLSSSQREASDAAPGCSCRDHGVGYATACGC